MKRLLVIVVSSLFVLSCENNNSELQDGTNENVSSFKEIGSITIGSTGAAEISAYDEVTKRLFTVNNAGTNRIDVIDLSNPSSPILIKSIDLTAYNGASNSVATFNGKLAVALEATPVKQNPGKVLVFDTSSYSLLKEIVVGALPDMIAFSPNGKYILTANEGEPSDDYSSDPEGSISIIDLNNNYAVTNLNLSGFSNQLATLRTKGFRISSPTNNFVNDIEPEYITISSDSKTAWVTLQENNGVAKIDLITKQITNLFPLGFKDYNLTQNSIDIYDKDLIFFPTTWKLKGMYNPDAITNYEVNGIQYFITANEGDAREYSAFKDISRINSSSVVLDPAIFTNALALKADASMGRLNINTKMGDLDGDGDLDELVSFGARSFTIWNGSTGELVFDSKNDLDTKAKELGVYDDARSDDKSVEPESVYVAKMGNKNILFVGLERADALMIYDVTNPSAPVFLQSLKTGDAPEGLLFIPASKSPTKRSLVVISSEGDGSVKIFQPDLN